MVRCGKLTTVSQEQGVLCFTLRSSRDHTGLGFGEKLRWASTASTAESESLRERLCARLRQSRDCSTWQQAQIEQPYRVGARPAELETASSPGQRSSRRRGQAWSLSEDAWLGEV